jgi:DNA-binding IclR family transcriptional regulator
VTRLAEMLRVSKQAASRLADDMVALGFVERAADAGDRRLLADCVERHGGAEELAAQRSRVVEEPA